MSLEIRMPRVIESMTHGAVASWRKAEGEHVRAGEVVAEIEADKTTVDLQSPGEGTLARIIVPAGTEKIEVGAVLAVIDETALPAPPALESGRRGGNGQSPGVAAEPAPAVAPAAPSRPRGEHRASPLAHSLARQAGIDLASLSGTGADGTITQADILRALGGPADRDLSPDPSSQAVAPTDAACETVPHSRVRQAIARRLSESKRTIPHFYLEVQCCMDALFRMKDDLWTRAGGLKLSLNDLAVRAAALALRAVPEVNASWAAEGIRRYRRIDLSVAVATPAGLAAPVIRDADRKGLAELAVELRDLAARAREGRLRPEELEGGTFTVSNLGMHGIDAMYAIINPPQAAILGLGAAAPRPIARGGAVAVATMMTCTLSADHRVLDGATGARLLSAFKGFVEEPLTMLV